MPGLPRLAVVALDSQCADLCNLPSARIAEFGTELVLGKRGGDETVNAPTQPDIVALLEQAGARPRGTRHDCPKCGGFRTVTHSEEAFYCHRCQWKGNVVTLMKEPGVYRRIPKAEYLRQMEARKRAESQARNFLAACRSERLRIAEALRELGRLELLAYQAGPSEEAWGALALVYQQQPRLAAEYALLSEGSIPTRRRWLEGSPEVRERLIADSDDGDG